MIPTGWKISLVLLVVVGALLAHEWLSHDRKEQSIGETACVNAAAAAGDAQAQATGATNLDNAKTLAQVVQSYDDKIRALNSANSDLAQRLHDAAAAEVHLSAMPNVSAPAGFVCSAADDGRPTARDEREAKDLDACAANTIELIELREAWQRLAEKKGAEAP